MNKLLPPSERKADYARKWRAKNRDHVRAYRTQYSREWRKRQGDAYRVKDRDSKRKRALAMWLNRAGWTMEQYEVRRRRGCGICGSRSKRLVFDHDHEAGHVRGLLCISCNVKLDWAVTFGDSIRGYIKGERP